MRKVRIPLTALLLVLTLVAGGCSDKRPSSTALTGASVTEQTSSRATSSSTPATILETLAVPTPAETIDNRTVEVGGQEYAYVNVLSNYGYTELYAPENGPDLSGLADLFEKIGYQASAEQEDAADNTLTLRSEDSGATVQLTTHQNSADAHEELYRYVVKTLAENTYIEQTFQLNLYVDLEKTYLSVTHFVMSGEGNHFVLYYQSGAQVIRAELPEDAHTIDDFMQVMQQLGLARANLEYDKEQITLPARAVDCSAQSFFDMLKKYDYPIEEPIDDSFVVYGENVAGTIYWTYEQSDSTAYQKTQFTMNYAFQLCNLADSRFSYFSGENYEGWIIDSDTQGYEIMIHSGKAGYYIHGKTNDDAMKAHILEMIEAVGFGGE